MKNKIATLGNRADQIEERIRDIEHRNLEMTEKGETWEWEKKKKN